MNIKKIGLLTIAAIFSINCGHIRVNKSINEVSEHLIENNELINSLYSESECFKKEIDIYSEACRAKDNVVFVFGSGSTPMARLICSDKDKTSLQFLNDMDPKVVKSLKMKLLCEESNSKLRYRKLYYFDPSK